MAHNSYSKMHWIIEITRTQFIGAYPTDETFRYCTVGHPQKVLRYLQGVVQGMTDDILETIYRDQRIDLDDDYNPCLYYAHYEHDKDGPCLAVAIAYAQVGIEL